MNELKIKNASMLKEVSEETYNCYVKQYNNYLAENSLPMNMESLMSYIYECQEYYSIRSMGVIKAALKKAIEETYLNTPYFLQFSHAIDKAFSKIKIGKADARIHSDNILNDNEIETLLTGGEWYNAKMKKKVWVQPDIDIFYLIQFLRDTGMRISEVITLEKGIFTHKEGISYFSFIGKGKKQRRNFVLTALLSEIQKVYNKGIYLFDYHNRNNRYTEPEKETVRKWISHKLNSYSKKVLGREINPHDFRHYFATKLLKEGKSLKAIAQWLGHSSTSVTSDMYVHDELTVDDLY
jgi:integrase